MTGFCTRRTRMPAHMVEGSVQFVGVLGRTSDHMRLLYLYDRYMETSDASISK